MLRVYLSLIIILMVVPVQAQEVGESDAPYLYYYSQEINAFVIERADGTDSRLLGDGLMADETNAVTGPGWSPSGEWFAWIGWWSPIPGHPTSEPHRAYLTDVSGKAITLPEAAREAEDIRMLWSPNNLLLIATQRSQAVREDNHNPDWEVISYFAIFDPASEVVLAEVEKRHIHDGLGMIGGTPLDYMPDLTVMWALDQPVAIVGYTIEDDPGIWKQTYTVMNVNGQVTDRYPEGLPNDRPHNRNLAFVVSPTGFLSYTEGKTLILENLITSERLVFEAAGISWIEWNAAGDIALLVGHTVKSLKLETGKIIELHIPSIHYSELWTTTLLWSPDNYHVLLPIIDGKVSYVDLLTNSSTPLDITGGDYGAPTLNGYWLDNVQVFVDQPESVVYFNFQTQERLDYPLPSYAFSHYVSPDHRYVASVFSQPTIYDLETGTTHNMLPDTRSYMSNPGGDIIWDVNSEWLIVRSEASVTSGNYRHLAVAKKDWSILRELDDANSPSSITINWLPSPTRP